MKDKKKVKDFDEQQFVNDVIRAGFQEDKKKDYFWAEYFWFNCVSFGFTPERLK